MIISSHSPENIGAIVRVEARATADDERMMWNLPAWQARSVSRTIVAVVLGPTDFVTGRQHKTPVPVGESFLIPDADLLPLGDDSIADGETEAISNDVAVEA